MKLKLREKELPPVQLRLVVPAGLKEMLDEYVGFVREGSGREVEARTDRRGNSRAVHGERPSVQAVAEA